MKILCLNPPFKAEHGRFSRSSRSPAITKSGTIYYPVWLAYVAGVLEEAGHDVKLVDSCAYGLDLDGTMRLVREFAPDMSVLDTSSPSIYSDVETGLEIKRAFPASFVVLMGTHPSALPEETLLLGDDRTTRPIRPGAPSPPVDAIAVGEADYTVRELASILSAADLSRLQSDRAYRLGVLGQIRGLAFRSGKHVFMNEKRNFIEDLDGLPFVSGVYKRHLDPRKYFFAASDYPEVQIMTARGCVARCTFCVYPQTIHGWKYRTRSPRNVADEFQWIAENMPEVREIGIEDDTFTGSQRRVVEFCKELVERKIRIKWYCNVRTDLRYETMEWMKRAGCVLVTVGYESANNQILESIDKRVTSEMILEFSRNTRRAGLLVHGCFMAGNIGDTRGTLEESLRMSLELFDDTMQFFPLMAYPGTAAYERAKRDGLLSINDYRDYLTADGCHNSVLRTRDMTCDEIRRWCDYARRKYYLRPRYIYYKLLQQVRRPSEIRRTFKSAKRFVRFLVP